MVYFRVPADPLIERREFGIGENQGELDGYVRMRRCVITLRVEEEWQIHFQASDFFLVELEELVRPKALKTRGAFEALICSRSRSRFKVETN